MLLYIRLPAASEVAADATVKTKLVPATGSKGVVIELIVVVANKTFVPNITATFDPVPKSITPLNLDTYVGLQNPLTGSRFAGPWLE